MPISLNFNSPSAGNNHKSLAIIGGGVAGLSAAFYALRHSPTTSVTLFESSPRWGGVLQTHRQDGFLIERSADSFLVTDQLPHMLELAEHLNVLGDLIEPNQEHRRALIVRDGELLPVPAGFQLMAATRLSTLLLSPALPFSARIRAACERWVPEKRDETEESVTEFITRRIGKTAFEYLAQPLVAGIYSADPDLLSAPAAIRQYVEFERRFGSVTRGLASTNARREAASGARYGKFRTFPGGMQSLVDALLQELEAMGAQLKSNCRVSSIVRTSDGWQVASSDSRDTFDRLIVSSSASSAASLLAETDESLSKALAEIPYTNLAVVSLAVPKSSMPKPLDAFGVVVPRREQRRFIAASFSSAKFPGRAPHDHELVRIFIGGALQPELARLPADDLRRIAIDELGRLLNLNQPARVLDIAVWSDASPQYNLGHLERLELIERRLKLLPGLQLAGSGYEGVGLPQCIRGAKRAAEK